MFSFQFQYNIVLSFWNIAAILQSGHGFWKAIFTVMGCGGKNKNFLKINVLVTYVGVHENKLE